MHSENTGKFERPRLFSVWELQEIWGWVLHEIWETKYTHIQNIPCEFAWGLLLGVCC